MPINDNLEAMANEVFKYWFEQYNFPNADGQPYRNSGGEMQYDSMLGKWIPKSWVVLSLSQIMEYSGGSQPPASEFINEAQDGYIRFVQIRDYYTDAHITYIPESRRNKLCNEKDIMIARYGASLGRICYGLKGAYNVALAKITPKQSYYREFLRLYLSSEVFYKRINAIGARAAQAGFNRDDIDQMLIAFPKDDNIIKSFETKMALFFEQKLQRDIEIKQLSKQRDELLPLLMNGQVSVNYHLSDD